MAGLAVADLARGVFGINQFDDGAWLRRVVGDGVLVGRVKGLGAGQAHQGVAVGGDKGEAGHQLLAGEAVELGVHFRAAAEDALNAELGQGDFFAEGFEEPGRGEDALHVVVGLEDLERLIDNVGLVVFPSRASCRRG